ncbi:hypothetical protein [Vitiosangium sp. GDMCC 1.1324]|uniref:hypothetical protein n=1 Tax=Vitiosangium sp. (strain GDMCC 1.1324) TaxID=2138576 RepID=UPI000D3C8A8D|nr:hypothetical protein [Vitiosangium sp. GDMCC 1.1324]PTL83459.1 hypothetical protein DAT35_15940 [Vitiosangium sp. GDMCC 1.1324]
MRLFRFPLLLAVALLSSAPAWSGDAKSVEKTVAGKLVSIEDNGMGETYTVETADGTQVKAKADPGTEWPENVKPGDLVVMDYAEVSTPRVAEVRLPGGPKFKKKPASTVQGTLVGYQTGDMGDYIVIKKKNGQQENYLADFGVLEEEQVSANQGKKVELAVYTFHSKEFRDIKPRP